MRKGIMLVVAGLAGLIVAQAAAAGVGALSYSYVEASYLRYAPKNAPKDLNGFDINGSFDLGSSMFITAGYRSVDSNYSVISSDFGYRFTVAPDTDVYALVGGAYATYDMGKKYHDRRLSAGFGLRTALSPEFELGAAVKFPDLMKTNEKTSLLMNARYNVTREMSAGVGYETSSNLGIWSFSGRFAF